MIKELRKKSNKDLANLIMQMKSQLLEYRFRAASGNLEKTHQVKAAKKAIAMAFTILRERNVDLLISSNDHALLEYKDGKRIITSLRKDMKPVEMPKKEEKPKAVEPVKKVEEKPQPKPKMVDGVEVGKKHIEVKMSDLEVYDYNKRRMQWRNNAGYNENAIKCSICKLPKHSSILTDTGKHICYLCFIKKSEFQKNQGFVVNNDKKTKTNNSTKTRMIRNQSKG